MQKKTRRRLFVAAGALIGGLVLMDKTTTRPTLARWVGPPIRLDRGVGEMTAAQVGAWAAQLGIPTGHLLLMIMLHSERGGSAQHRAEHEAIARTAVNRMGYPAKRGGFVVPPAKVTWWNVLVGPRARTTGRQGYSGRPYATTRPPTEAAEAAYLFDVAAEAIARGAYRGPGPAGITHFHHNPTDETTRRWGRRGYVAQDVGPVAGTFMAPTAAKAASLS